MYRSHLDCIGQDPTKIPGYSLNIRSLSNCMFNLNSSASYPLGSLVIIALTVFALDSIRFFSSLLVEMDKK